MSAVKYDYIIVGAGSAGCVLAARLIQETQSRVLLIEAGDSDNHLFIRMPAGVAKIIAQKSWPYETEPEPHANNRKMQIAQGKVLGGSSSVNGMIYIRGQKQDYDNWALNYGCEGWGYADVLPWFKKAENNESLTGEYHGTEGPLPVSENRYRHPLSMAFIRAAQEHGLPYLNDLNGESQQGASFYQTTTHNGERASTSRTYLKSVEKNDKLTLKLGTQVNRIIIRDGRAIGVAYQGKNGHEVEAFASCEVLVCSGAMGSAKLLMLSGIGPEEHLSSLGIDTHVNLPVGKNFHDHLHMSINVTTKQPISLFGADQGLNAIKHGVEWIAFRSGLLTSNVLEGAAFKDSCSQGRPDVQIHFLPILDSWDDVPGEPLPAAHGFSLKVGYLQPKSRGEVLLRSADPQAPLKIHANYLASPEDMEGCKRAVKFGLEVLDCPSLQVLSKEVLMPPASVRYDEAQLEEFVRNFCKTVYHPVGTCRMGTDTTTSVTDLRLRVHGIENLRVVDCSVMPEIPSGNTNAPTIMIAERAAAMIIEDRNCNGST
ncbi:GMC family oxidoreductase [Providencia hangzhouensis]|uniref:GMC family oxidoreductase N-terminal domain-containing protein n=1 Tax=Providencia rettgeri TaxID=587 RepID=A0AAJ4NEZ4_PRORE|nr:MULTISPECIES: GMC family oxidoreductase N-terminal domain-containing protein [Providencia]MBJ9969609.1 GMC family oxidoreductase N-terminal domain-containing protein [Providencia rettgeri]MCF8961664.1 Alcohol dehydrogenase [acceptor] [Providencia rettgeri]QWQ15303.1 GMC family oxidoreductase N-terminal domain-containing protein [Providencia rettgeri]QWQ19134.1 GMC family oxidoreductase N-terminal domain-containing protein [Providencia rettgeri]QWQ22970.1 GMC family oxidoreductase N-terminal